MKADVVTALNRARSARCVFVLFLSAVSIGVVTGFGQMQADGPDWSQFNFLLGTWEAEGGGDPGSAQGSFTMSFDLQKRILVRRSAVEYPANRERAAFRHEDLMVFYQLAPGEMEAQYFDNEGHVIHYVVRASAGGDSLILLSDLTAHAPRFRFIYVRRGDGRLSTAFDIAPPDTPDLFQRYVEGIARKKE